MNDEPTELAIVEIRQLAVYEAVIERGLATFVDVGNALAAIRDDRLYRRDYRTFEDYCRERWGISKTQANRLISAHEVVGNLTPIGVIPSTESQARPLTRLEPSEQIAAWQEAVTTAPNGKVTAAHVAAVVDRRGLSTPHVSFNSGNNEWYTPSEYIEAARAVMGAIDLDPASSTIANSIVKAERYYTIEDDGCSLEWYGRVWLNPPYATDLVTAFANKLVAELAAGNVTEAIVLVNNATETAWFNTMIREARAVVFPKGRVKFWKDSGEVGAPLQGQAILYFGDSLSGFLQIFQTFGWGAKVESGI